MLKKMSELTKKLPLTLEYKKIGSWSNPTNISDNQSITKY